MIYAELERTDGVAQADIARRYRKSAGYVSVLCRLGRALRPLGPEERAALRVRQVTFKAAQAVVSRYASPADVRDALRDLADRPAPARRRRSGGGLRAWRETPAFAPHEDRVDPVLRAVHDAGGGGDDFVYRWDGPAAARDPGAALAAYEAFVRATTDEVIARLRRAAGTRVHLGPPSESAHDAASPVRHAPTDPVALDLSLRQLNERVAATLQAHRERMAQFLADRRASRPPRGLTVAHPPVAVTDAELADDFGDTR